MFCGPNHQTMNAMPTVKASDYPPQENWPTEGGKHTLNEHRFRNGGVFGWWEDGHLWTGIVEEVGPCSVRVRDILPGVSNPQNN
jgi:hypothetical protein